MPLSINPEIESLVDSLYRSGRFSSRDEVLDTALRLLQERHELEDKLLTGLQQLKAGKSNIYEVDEFDRFRADVVRVAEERRMGVSGK